MKERKNALMFSICTLHLMRKLMINEILYTIRNNDKFF